MFHKETWHEHRVWEVVTWEIPDETASSSTYSLPLGYLGTHVNWKLSTDQSDRRWSPITSAPLYWSHASGWCLAWLGPGSECKVSVKAAQSWVIWGLYHTSVCACQSLPFYLFLLSQLCLSWQNSPFLLGKAEMMFIQELKGNLRVLSLPGCPPPLQHSITRLPRKLSFSSCLLLFYMMVPRVQQEQRSLIFPLGPSEATENNGLFLCGKET